VTTNPEGRPSTSGKATVSGAERLAGGVEPAREEQRVGADHARVGGDVAAARIGGEAHVGAGRDRDRRCQRRARRRVPPGAHGVGGAAPEEDHGAVGAGGDARRRHFLAGVYGEGRDLERPRRGGSRHGAEHEQSGRDQDRAGVSQASLLGPCATTARTF
jgi:hypothetical protein